MKFTVKTFDIKNIKHSCMVIAIFEKRELSITAEKVDEISNSYISRLIKKGELEGKIGQTLLLYNIPNIISERVLLVGCGEKNNLDEYNYKKIIRKTTNVINNTGTNQAIYFLTELVVKDLNIYWKIRKTVEIIKDTLYNFNQFKTKNSNNVNCKLQKLEFNVLNYDDIKNGERAIEHGLAISNGIKIAKDLGNMPPNVCNAYYMASEVKTLTNQFQKNIITYIVDEAQMSKLGMHSYLSVGRGSKNESIMSVIEYKGNSIKNKNPIVLIGKGITFDSGGISIKSSESMEEMKYDMCGAAAVYGVIKVIAELQLPLNVIGILAGCENMPGGNAYRPGDIIQTMSGKTVEIINTDAEGRLVLCDVLTYVERFKPEVVIDIATLTGACVVTFGHHITALMSNDNRLAKELIYASKQSDDQAWILPLERKFQEQIESSYADIKNIGGKSGSIITAGCFLSRFTNEYNWAHLDIAGTAFSGNEKTKSATGRPVAMLSQYLINRSNDSNIN